MCSGAVHGPRGAAAGPCREAHGAATRFSPTFNSCRFHPAGRAKVMIGAGSPPPLPALLPARPACPARPRVRARCAPTPRGGWRIGRRRQAGDGLPLTVATGATIQALFGASCAAKSSVLGWARLRKIRTENPGGRPSRIHFSQMRFPHSGPMFQCWRARKRELPRAAAGVVKDLWCFWRRSRPARWCWVRDPGGRARTRDGWEAPRGSPGPRAGSSGPALGPWRAAPSAHFCRPFKPSLLPMMATRAQVELPG